MKDIIKKLNKILINRKEFIAEAFVFWNNSNTNYK